MVITLLVIEHVGKLGCSLLRLGRRHILSLIDRHLRWHHLLFLPI